MKRDAMATVKGVQRERAHREFLSRQVIADVLKMSRS
jgi:hypothetical protein